MDRPTFQSLLSPQGQDLLAEAHALEPDDATLLACLSRLGKRHPPELARAALQTVLLRARAASKFTRASAMYFTREALEQATSEAVARYRARRFHGLRRVADLGCGIGGDALALADCAEVVCVERDGLRLDLAAANLEAYGVRERCALAEGDALTVDVGEADAVFLDPDRRPGGKRRLSPRECEPSLEAVARRLPGALLAAKLAPGVPLEELSHLGGEVEMISLDGELKECALWLGGWAGPPRRATALPSGATLTDDAPLPPPRPPGRWLIDPGPAVARAGLAGGLAARLGAWPVDPSVLYLSVDDYSPDPLARAWRVREWMPLHAGRLRQHLRSRGVGRVAVSHRGVRHDPEALVRELRLTGEEAVTLVLTPVLGKACAVVCDAVPV
jgi:SAM-dependent methyltransferase